MDPDPAIANTTTPDRASGSPPPLRGPADPPRRSPGGGPPRAHLDPDHTGSPFASGGGVHGHAYFDQLRRRVRTRLLIGYVTPLLLLAAFFHVQFGRTLRVGIENHLVSIADNQRNTVDLFLQERVSNLRHAFEAIDPAQLPDHAETEQLLASLRAESDAFVDVGLFRPDGRLLSYAGPFDFLVGKSYQREAWFRQVLQADDNTTISDVYLGFRDQPHFVIAVTRYVDGFPWTLRASVDPERFGQFVGSSLLLEDAKAFIVNRGGYRQTLAAREQMQQQWPLPDIAGGETVVTELTVDGEQRLCAIAPLEENDWYLAVTTSRDQALAPIRRARAILGGVLAVALVTVVWIALRSTSRLVGQLEEADTAKESLQQHLFNAARLASVGEMAAGVAHEINNPLAIIYEEAGVMSDTLDPAFGQRVDLDEFRERLDAISGAALRGRNITRQLLAFARQSEPRPELLDINEEVASALQVKDTEFRVNDIEVETDLHPAPPPVRADRNQLEQVLLNLLNNARDALADRPARRIAIRTEVRGDAVCVIVRDTGCGMTPEQMERAFFPFFTTKEVGKGTGLGLSISYGIVRAQGGHIEVESQPGAGTAFTITLPAAEPRRDLPHEARRGEHVDER